MILSVHPGLEMLCILVSILGFGLKILQEIRKMRGFRPLIPKWFNPIYIGQLYLSVPNCFQWIIDYIDDFLGILLVLCLEQIEYDYLMSLVG